MRDKNRDQKRERKNIWKGKKIDSESDVKGKEIHFSFSFPDPEIIWIEESHEITEAPQKREKREREREKCISFLDQEIIWNEASYGIEEVPILQKNVKDRWRRLFKIVKSKLLA